MTSNYQSDLDSVATDSVASTPRSDYPFNETRVRFMCSFGGKILPRPHDNQLRYVGGDTRIVAVQRATTYASLLSKLSKLSAGLGAVTVKYQLPNEDLDSLISVTTDEDVENMMEEYDRIALNQNPKAARLRLFLFSSCGGDSATASRTSSISSLLDGSAKREHWFLDALNSGASNNSFLERGRSEASSIISEVPDYLFGLENSDESNRPKPRPSMLHDNVSASDPGSPAPVLSSPFCSTSSVPPIPNLPPVKTKPDPNPNVETKENTNTNNNNNQSEVYAETTTELPVPQATAVFSNPGLQYVQDPNYPGQVLRSVPVYYYPAPPVQHTNVPVIQHTNAPVQPVQMRTPYMQQQYPVQVPVGYHNVVPGMGQVYGGGLRPGHPGLDQYDVAGRVVAEGVKPQPQPQQQQVYYGVRNGVVPAYNPGMVATSGEEWQGVGSEINTGRGPNTS